MGYHHFISNTIVNYINLNKYDFDHIHYCNNNFNHIHFNIQVNNLVIMRLYSNFIHTVHIFIVNCLDHFALFKLLE